MIDALRFFNGITTKEFYTDIKARRQEYYSILEKYYPEIWEKGNVLHFGHLIKEQHIYNYYFDDRTIEPNVNYSIECYNERERLFLSKTKEQIFSDLDNEKIKVYVSLIVNHLIQLTKKVESLLLDEKYQQYKEDVASKLQNCISYLQETYLPNTPASVNASSSKIQWLGKTNILVTLIYDLWQGQSKGKETPSTPSQIKALKKDLEALLINNFIDSKGKPLTQSVISDYLNTSKPEKRAKKGVRIEL